MKTEGAEEIKQRKWDRETQRDNGKQCYKSETEVSWGPYKKYLNYEYRRKNLFR